MASVELTTFDTIRRMVQQLTGNRLDQARATTVLNTTILHLWNDYQWSRAKVEVTGTLRGPKSAGLVTLAFDPTKVNGFETAFTTADIGSYIRFETEIQMFRVINVVGQQLTLEAAYPHAAFANARYSLFRHIYPLPHDWRMFVSPTYWDYLDQVPQQQLDRIDPHRLQRASLPTHYAIRGPDPDGIMQAEIWPVPSTTVQIRYTYLRNLGPYSPLAGASLVPLRGDLVGYMAAGEGLMALAAEARNIKDAQVLVALGEKWLSLGQAILEEAYRADRQAFGVPDAVRPYRPGLEAMGAYYTFLPEFVDEEGVFDVDARLGAISWIEIEVPTVSTEARHARISWIELEAPEGPDRAGLISFIELQVPDVVPQRRGVLSFIEIEVPEGPDRAGQISWVELEVPDVVPQQRALISWVEIEVPDGQAREAFISWIEVEVPNLEAPRAGTVSWVEMEVPEGAARRGVVSWVELETPDAPP